MSCNSWLLPDRMLNKLAMDWVKNRTPCGVNCYLALCLECLRFCVPSFGGIFILLVLY